jgi:plasmid stabilization system protein ParE
VKRYRVRYTEEATSALREAATYILSQDGSDRARTWLQRMLDETDRLETLPGAFVQVTTIAGRAVRSILVLSYRVYYVIDEPSSTVYVIDVVHTARQTHLQKYTPSDQ